MELELEFLGSGSPVPPENEVVEWVRGSLMDAFEESLDTFRHDDIAIDSLEIDLGPIDSEIFRTEAPERLKRMLIGRIGEARRNPAKREDSVDDVSAKATAEWISKASEQELLDAVHRRSPGLYDLVLLGLDACGDGMASRSAKYAFWKDVFESCIDSSARSLSRLPGAQLGAAWAVFSSVRPFQWHEALRRWIASCTASDHAAQKEIDPTREVDLVQDAAKRQSPLEAMAASLRRAGASRRGLDAASAEISRAADNRRGAQTGASESKHMPLGELGAAKQDDAERATDVASSPDQPVRPGNAMNSSFVEGDRTEAQRVSSDAIVRQSTSAMSIDDSTDSMRAGNSPAVTVLRGTSRDQDALTSGFDAGTSDSSLAAKADADARRDPLHQALAFRSKHASVGEVASAMRSDATQTKSLALEASVSARHPSILEAPAATASVAERNATTASNEASGASQSTEAASRAGDERELVAPHSEFGSRVAEDIPPMERAHGSALDDVAQKMSPRTTDVASSPDQPVRPSNAMNSTFVEGECAETQRVSSDAARQSASMDSRDESADGMSAGNDPAVTSTRGTSRDQDSLAMGSDAGQPDSSIAAKVDADTRRDPLHHAAAFESEHVPAGKVASAMRSDATQTKILPFEASVPAQHPSISEAPATTAAVAERNATTASNEASVARRSTEAASCAADERELVAPHSEFGSRVAEDVPPMERAHGSALDDVAQKMSPRTTDVASDPDQTVRPGNAMSSVSIEGERTETRRVSRDTAARRSTSMESSDESADGMSAGNDPAVTSTRSTSRHQDALAMGSDAGTSDSSLTARSDADARRDPLHQALAFKSEHVPAGKVESAIRSDVAQTRNMPFEASVPAQHPSLPEAPATTASVAERNTTTASNEASVARQPIETASRAANKRELVTPHSEFGSRVAERAAPVERARGSALDDVAHDELPRTADVASHPDQPVHPGNAMESAFVEGGLAEEQSVSSDAAARRSASMESYVGSADGMSTGSDPAETSARTDSQGQDVIASESDTGTSESSLATKVDADARRDPLHRAAASESEHMPLGELGAAKQDDVAQVKPVAPEIPGSISQQTIAEATTSTESVATGIETIASDETPAARRSTATLSRIAIGRDLAAPHSEFGSRVADDATPMELVNGPIMDDAAHEELPRTTDAASPPDQPGRPGNAMNASFVEGDRTEALGVSSGTGARQSASMNSRDESADGISVGNDPTVASAHDTSRDQDALAMGSDAAASDSSLAAKSNVDAKRGTLHRSLTLKSEPASAGEVASAMRGDATQTKNLPLEASVSTQHPLLPESPATTASVAERNATTASNETSVAYQPTETASRPANEREFVAPHSEFGSRVVEDVPTMERVHGSALDVVAQVGSPRTTDVASHPDQPGRPGNARIPAFVEGDRTETRSVPSDTAVGQSASMQSCVESADGMIDGHDPAVTSAHDTSRDQDALAMAPNTRGFESDSMSEEGADTKRDPLHQAGALDGIDRQDGDVRSPDRPMPADACVREDAELEALMQRIPSQHRQTVLDSILLFARRSSRPDAFVKEVRAILEEGHALDLDAALERIEAEASSDASPPSRLGEDALAEEARVDETIPLAPTPHAEDGESEHFPPEVADLLGRLAAIPSEARMDLHRRLRDAATHAHLHEALAQVARRILVNRSLPELASFLSDCEAHSMQSDVSTRSNTSMADDTAAEHPGTLRREGVDGDADPRQASTRERAAIPVEAIEHAIRQVPDIDAKLALQCVDMVTEIVLRFASETDRARIRHAGREICYRELVHKGVPFHPRKLSEALLTGFQDALPGLEPRTVATMILRRLSLPPFAPPTRSAPAVGRTFARDSAMSASEGVRVGNAGLVIAGAYMPRLFSLLDLIEGDAFRDGACRSRALHVLHWLARGRDAAEDHGFDLERVLCGAPSDWMPDDGIQLGEKEKTICDQLLAGIIQNWKVLGNTSPQGLRETFLDRIGTLRMHEETWRLDVVPGTFDMLIDRLPWSFAMIRHPWMEHPLQTKWRES